MKIFLFVLALSFFFTNLAFAEDFFVHSPQMSSKKFEEWIARNQKTDFKRLFLARNSIQNLNRLPISADIRSLRKSIEMLDQQPMLVTEVESSIFLYQKIGLENLTKKEKRRFVGLITSSEKVMLQHANELQKLSAEVSPRDPSDPDQWLGATDLLEIANYLKSSESLILVDGVPLKSKDNLNDQKVSKQVHQWIYVSNSSNPILYVGGFSNFVDQLSSLKPLSNKCGEELVPWEGMQNIKLKNIGSSTDCFDDDNSSNKSDFANGEFRESSRHHEKIEAWALPLSIVATGLALSYFRNKEITFHAPSFKF